MVETISLEQLEKIIPEHNYKDALALMEQGLQNFYLGNFRFILRVTGDEEKIVGVYVHGYRNKLNQWFLNADPEYLIVEHEDFKE